MAKTSTKKKKKRWRPGDLKEKDTGTEEADKKINSPIFIRKDFIRLNIYVRNACAHSQR